MKLEVGMYIRTDKGFIAKVKEFKHHYTKGKRSEDGYSVKEVTENYLSLDGNQCRLIESIDYSIPPCYPSDEELDEIKSHIVKASYNIIDILEVGDYVNGSEILDFKYEFIEENDNFTNFAVVTENCYLENTNSWIIEKNIKSVITHEQIEQMAYKVGE